MRQFQRLNAGTVFFAMRAFYWTDYDYTVIKGIESWSLAGRPYIATHRLLL